jgi:transcriptional regulator with XRE-family HTH domain
VPKYTGDIEFIRRDFARRVEEKMLGKGWNQSELARRAGLNRDQISGYVRGLNLPFLGAQKKLAKALECEVSDLFPTGALKRPNDATDDFEIKSVGDGRVLLRVRVVTTLDQAMRASEILFPSVKRK